MQTLGAARILVSEARCARAPDSAASVGRKQSASAAVQQADATQPLLEDSTLGPACPTTEPFLEAYE